MMMSIVPLIGDNSALSSYETVEKQREGVGPSKILPKSVDIFTKLRSIDSNNWVAEMKNFEHRLTYDVEFRTELVANRVRWKLHLHDFCVTDVPKEDASIASRKSGGQDPEDEQSLAILFLRQTILVLGMLDLETLLRHPKTRESFVKRSLDIIVKASVAARLGMESVALHQHGYLTYILGKISEVLPEMGKGEINRNSSPGVSNTKQDEEDDQKAVNTYKLADSKPLESFFHSEINNGEYNKKGKCTIKITDSHWDALADTVAASIKVICETPSASSLSRLIEANRDLAPPTFLIRFLPNGKFACEDLVEISWEVIGSKVL
mmetsp:Transcript_3787/g.5019  ORF Transcript_3787/g.5019 Transcript_3787/m.5019 type:complete len:322 (+) Transcript_3787:121-1086(+)